MEWPTACTECCFEVEPASYWFTCEYCTRNPQAKKEPTDDRFTDKSLKTIYFDPR